MLLLLVSLISFIDFLSYHQPQWQQMAREPAGWGSTQYQGSYDYQSRPG